MFEPGEIYMADIDLAFPHPVVVVSRTDLNRGNWVVAVLITSTHFQVRSHMPNCVPFRAGEFGLSKDCVAQAETITAIRKDRLDMARGIIGKLDDARLRDLVKAIGFMMDSDCEPN